MFEFFKKKEENAENKENKEEKKGFNLSFSMFKNIISKTQNAISESVSEIVSSKQKIDDDMLDEMEETLIKADIGLDTAVSVVEKLREKQNKLTPDDIKPFLKNEFNTILKEAGECKIHLKDGLNIFLITGVNGAGKTTLIGKLAYQYKNEGKRVLIAAADTFRAAAEEQLEIWSNRAGADIVRKDGADPASVVFDAIKKAQAENYDILLIDTAGRLQNKFNLMEELKKIVRVIKKEAPEQITESLLVIDANTGQNGLKQAEVFKEATDLSSIAITKLDGSAKGGIIIAIAKEMKLPVKLIGVGEKMTDLKEFNSDYFTDALFD